MALNVTQYEEIASLLRQVPRLVDRLETRRSGFPEGVLEWLKQAEIMLENNRIPAVSQIASCRAMLIGAARGLRAKEVSFVGRATPRKIHDATASMVLERSNELLHGVIAERQAVFQEAERITRQIMVIAEAKGFIRACNDGRPRQAFLTCLQQSIAEDRDLVNAYSHLLALVGKTDILIFIDRALPKIA